MNALRFQPIYVTLPPVSLQAVLSEGCSGGVLALAHTPILSWKPEGPRSVLAVTDKRIGKVGRSRCRFSAQVLFNSSPCTAISRAPGHSETIRGGALGRNRMPITLIIRAFDPRTVRAPGEGLAHAAVQR